MSTRNLSQIDSSNRIRAAEFLSDFGSIKSSRQKKRIPVHLVSFRGPEGNVGNRDRATHFVHWYPAKMFYRIPDQILESFPPQQDATLLDPFCGSGTVLIEGMLRGYQVIGIDVNPLARMISRVRTTCLDEVKINRQLPQIIQAAKSFRSLPDTDQLPEYWFSSKIRPALHRLHRAISNITDERYREFFLISLSHIVRRCSLADPTIPPPVRMTEERAEVAGKRYQRNFEYSKALEAHTVYERFHETVIANQTRLQKLFGSEEIGNARILDNTAMNLGLPNKSIDLVITSPPYCGAQKYVRSLSLEMRLLRFSSDELRKIDRGTLGTERVSIVGFSPEKFSFLPKKSIDLIKELSDRNIQRTVMLANYLKGLTGFATELRRVMKPDGHAFVSFGVSRIAGLEVDLADLFTEIAKEVGLLPISVLKDHIPSRGMITKRHESASTIQCENVVWLRCQKS